MTYNLRDYGADPAVHGARYRLAEQVIREADPYLLLVQELMTQPAKEFWMSPDQKWQHRVGLAPELVAGLADRTGLAVPLVDGRPAGGRDRRR